MSSTSTRMLMKVASRVQPQRFLGSTTTSSVAAAVLSRTGVHNVRTFASKSKATTTVKEAEIAEEKPFSPGKGIHLDDPTPLPPNPEAERLMEEMLEEDDNEPILERKKDAGPFKTDFTEEEKKILDGSNFSLTPEPEVPDIPRPTSTKSHAFQAETAQLLRIVTHSLYTDKEVFLRELVSNASDALEKVRYLQNTGEPITDPELPLEVRITVDTKNKCISITDTGIGMNDEEIISNLGTIARSGSRMFMQELNKSGNNGSSPSSETASNIIGQFGVGFYSSFMVSGDVEVVSSPGRINNKGSDRSYYWKSSGTGDYELAEVPRRPRGTTLILHIREECHEFVSKHMIETIIKKYSNFVNFPIYLNDEKVNTLGAIWAMPKDSVSDELHGQFYRFIANSYDYPTYRLHFSVDAPIAITALLYFPERHMERFGLGRMEPSVSLYSRRVLIQGKSKELLPDWLRFMKGVVDSEDIPLNISRESMQDTRLLTKIRTAVTRRVLKFLNEQATKDPAKFLEFYKEYMHFIKEGAISDAENRKDVAKLLRYDSNLDKDPSKESFVSFDDYVGRMPPTQKNIYFLQAPSRQLAFNSPYYEPFKDKGIEVLFLYSPMDDFVMRNVGEFNGRKLVSIEGEEPEELKKEEDAATKAQDAIFEQSVIEFFKTTLSDRVSEVKSSSRLKESPAIIVANESSVFRKMMRMVDQQNPQHKPMEAPKQKLEVNTKHPLLIQLRELISQPSPEFRSLAEMVCEQIYDDALIQADLLENPTQMIPRLNRIMEKALNYSVASMKPVQVNPQAENSK